MANETSTTETTDEEQTLAEQIIDDLTVELSVTDTNFNAVLLTSKVNAAIREVKKARNYPDYYTDEQIDSDMKNLYSCIRAISMYDYNTIGMEGQSASSENSTSRTMIDRKTLFAGVIPLSRS